MSKLSWKSIDLDLATSIERILGGYQQQIFLPKVGIDDLDSSYNSVSKTIVVEFSSIDQSLFKILPTLGIDQSHFKDSANPFRIFTELHFTISLNSVFIRLLGDRNRLYRSNLSDFRLTDHYSIKTNYACEILNEIKSIPTFRWTIVKHRDDLLPSPEYFHPRTRP
jgi:hypothetical protein